MSGCIPELNNSFTECWVGLVLNSLATDTNGNKVRCIKHVFFLPNSFLSCLIASRNGKLSISPTVPPISQITKSSFDKSVCIKFLI